LPGVSRAAQEISLIVGALAGAFAFFEYASSHPGLVEFRFAPPFNRVRYFTLLMQLVLLIFVCRHTVSPDEITTRVDEFAAMLWSRLDMPFSPVRLVTEMLAEGTPDAYRQLLSKAAALSFTVAFTSLTLFTLVLWFFGWPVRRENFNLWVNLPTFEPASARDVERRLMRDGFANVIIGLALLYLLPVIASRSSGWYDPVALQRFQPLVWTIAFWAFLPAAFVIRGAALMKISYLVKRSRRR
jgi:hypothetical protein